MGTVIASAIPYAQMGILKSLYYYLFPRQLTLADFDSSINGHLFGLGTSGSGKSRLITKLAQGHIAAGHSLFLIDTSADPFRQVLYHCIREGIDPSRVIILDATRPDIPVPDFHIFEVPEGSFADSIVDGLVAAHRGFLGDSFGERQADILRMLAYTFIKSNAPFLPWSIRFLTEDRIRNAILKRADDTTLTAFWKHMTGQRSYNMVIESTRNKLNALAMNTLVSQYFDSNRSTVDLYTAFNEGKIILLNLSENHYKDRSSRALLGALFLFLAHQALLRRELDPAHLKTPVVLLLDEAHQYYVSDFVLPFYTGTRKHNVGIQLFSQSTNNFPKNDIDIFLATAAHLIAFGIGSHDAERIVKDLIMPQDRTFLKDADGFDLYGPYGDLRYYSISEQREHAVAELIRQSQRCLFWRVRTTNAINLYLCETAPTPTLTVSSTQEDAYRRASAEHHAKNDIIVPTPIPVAQPVSSPPPTVVLDTAPVALPAAPLPAKTVPPAKVLSSDEQSMLSFVGTLEELLSVRDVYKRLKISADKGTRLKAQLVDAGLMIEVEVPLHAKGRNSKLLVLTAKGLEAVGLPVRAGKGGALHQHLQRVIAMKAEQYDFGATIEARGPNGKAVDIGLEKDGRRIAVELCITTRPPQELHNLLADLQGGYERVITLCVAPAVVDALQRLAAEQDAAVAARVRCGLVKDFVSLLGGITPQGTGKAGD